MLAGVNKHVLYQLAAQAGPTTELMGGVHRKWVSEAKCAVRGPSAADAAVLREDFAGTGLVALQWLQGGPARRAVLVDTCADTLAWGAANNAWTADAEARRTTVVGDVLDAEDAADLTCALNSSWCAFLDDDTLLRYFRSARSRSGMLFLDLYGGPGACATGAWTSQVPTPMGTVSYTWEHTAFDPQSSEVRAAMHFALQGGGETLKNAFEYHWKLRDPATVKEMLHAAGYEHVSAWMEQRAPGGGGGAFGAVDLGDADKFRSAFWTCYVSAA